MNHYEMTDSNGFEVQPCGRCGGSGHYSFNLMHGTTCFGCSGKGFKYTKRGHEAHDYYMKLRSRKYSELKVGDVVYMRDFYRGWRTVTEVEHKDGGQVVVTFTHGYCLQISGESTVTLDGLATEAKEKALAYQDTLTKTGKVSKR